MASTPTLRVYLHPCSVHPCHAGRVRGGSHTYFMRTRTSRQPSTAWERRTRCLSRQMSAPLRAVELLEQAVAHALQFRDRQIVIDSYDGIGAAHIARNDQYEHWQPSTCKRQSNATIRCRTWSGTSTSAEGRTPQAGGRPSRWRVRRWRALAFGKSRHRVSLTLQRPIKAQGQRQPEVDVWRVSVLVSRRPARRFRQR